MSRRHVETTPMADPNDPIPLDTIVHFVDEHGDGRTPMYYKGRCKRAREGIVGLSVRLRPVAMGVGVDYIMTAPGHRVVFDAEV